MVLKTAEILHATMRVVALPGQYGWMLERCEKCTGCTNMSRHALDPACFALGWKCYPLDYRVIFGGDL